MVNAGLAKVKDSGLKISTDQRTEEPQGQGLEGHHEKREDNREHQHGDVGLEVAEHAGRLFELVHCDFLSRSNDALVAIGKYLSGGNSSTVSVARGPTFGAHARQYGGGRGSKEPRP